MWFKAVVIEIKNDYAIVMKSDSTMERVKIKQNMNIGDVLLFLENDLYLKENKIQTNNKLILAILSMAAAIVLLIIPILNSNLKDTSYAVVSLDINPSIELELDKNKNIVNINSLNKDGNKLNLENLIGLSIEEGIEKLKINLEIQGYKLIDDSIIVGFTFLTDIEDIDYEDYIKNMLSKHLSESKIAYLKGNKQDYIESNKGGISLGRYEAKLDIEDDILEQQLEEMTVEELLALLKNKNIYLNEEILEEIEDEVEDKLEESKDNDDKDEDIKNNNHSTEENDNEEDDDNEDRHDDDYDDDESEEEDD